MNDIQCDCGEKATTVFGGFSMCDKCSIRRAIISIAIVIFILWLIVH